MHNLGITAISSAMLLVAISSPIIDIHWLLRPMGSREKHSGVRKTGYLSLQEDSKTPSGGSVIRTSHPYKMTHLFVFCAVLPHLTVLCLPQ